MNRENVKVETSYNGIGLLGLTFVVLLTLKLLGYAPETLTWFIVFLPLMIGFGFWLLIILFIFIVAIIIGSKK